MFVNWSFFTTYPYGILNYYRYTTYFGREFEIFAIGLNVMTDVMMALLYLFDVQRMNLSQQNGITFFLALNFADTIVSFAAVFLLPLASVFSLVGVIAAFMYDYSLKFAYVFCLAVCALVTAINFIYARRLYKDTNGDAKKMIYGINVGDKVVPKTFVYDGTHSTTIGDQKFGSFTDS
ncbi:unnamed protein product [Bursaphelenchus okinawaensis]|uniref:Uncharacterized protein n=1 Tax=Bursaphelenchus okinawaensis TaxID=465554 RepID=A0A811LU36_9BILA|nr:unnamed protein product [Bursaphelenchus okinawaensis]CAG9128074.1 unnamed protein product [Bursaphelenchus okinawaensis]